MPVKYEPVFHFEDPNLYKRFVSKIPRATFLDVLRADDKFRNRCFPGFRISDTSPNEVHVHKVFRREILQHRNSGLANHLCEDWLGRSPGLVRSALQSLKVVCAEQTATERWLKPAQDVLSGENHAEILRALAKDLSSEHTPEEILIFVSIIGYGRDQQILRDLVEQGLRYSESSPASPPLSDVSEPSGELCAAMAALAAAEEARAQLIVDLAGETKTAQRELESAVRELQETTEDIAMGEKDTDALSKQIEDLQRRKADVQGALELGKGRRSRLTETLTERKKRTADLAANQAGRMAEADRILRMESQNLENVRASLKALEARHAEKENIEGAVAAQDNAPRNVDGLGNNAVCYQALQRIFRNSVVAFLRGRLPRVFPTDHTLRLQKLFGEHWEKAAQNAIQSRQIGGTNTAVRDGYDLLGINHFFEVFDKFFDKLFAAEADPESTLPRPVKTKLLGNLKTIKDGRDPLSHPVEEEVSFEEAYHLLIEAKQVLSWIGCEAQASEIATLATKLQGGELDVTPPIVRRLPSEDSIYQEFVGRGTVLADLAGCFANPDSRRCLLAGDGGKGKSAVAYRFAQDLSASPGRFQLIIWLSAKRRKFQAGATTAIELPDFANAEEAIDRLLGEYGATDSDLAKSKNEKRGLLMDYLNTLPAFIIADDIDTVLDDYDVVSLFTHEIPHTQSAVLLTSRRDIPGIRSFVVKEFDVDEASQFIKSRVKLFGLNGLAFSQSVVAEIVRATDGSPLYMDDLLRLTKVLDVKAAIRMWQEKKGDEARKYALQRELEKLTSDAKKVLLAAAMRDDPISFAELENILRIPEERLYSSLNELQTLFLFPKPRVVENEQRFQINLNTKKLVRLVEANSDLYSRVERASRALAGQLPNVGRGIVSSLIRQAQLRLNSGKFTEAEAILQEAITKYPNMPDLWGFLGYAYRREGRIADARTQFEMSSKLKGSNREMYFHWIRMEISSQEWSKAVNVADKALRVHPKFYEIVERKVYAQRQAGFDFNRGLHREKAEKMWSDAVDEVKRSIRSPEELESGARQLNASMFSTIVICLDMLGRFRERDSWLERWEKEHPDDPQVSAQRNFLDKKDLMRNQRRGLSVPSLHPSQL
jgi:tetratricopeptide (TPR) repeat protein/TolA-binding protein